MQNRVGSRNSGNSLLAFRPIATRPPSSAVLSSPVSILIKHRPNEGRMIAENNNRRGSDGIIGHGNAIQPEQTSTTILHLNESRQIYSNVGQLLAQIVNVEQETNPHASTVGAHFTTIKQQLNDCLQDVVANCCDRQQRQRIQGQSPTGLENNSVSRCFSEIEHDLHLNQLLIHQVQSNLTKLKTKYIDYSYTGQSANQAKNRSKVSGYPVVRTTPISSHVSTSNVRRVTFSIDNNNCKGNRERSLLRLDRGDFLASSSDSPTIPSNSINNSIEMARGRSSSDNKSSSSLIRYNPQHAILSSDTKSRTTLVPVTYRQSNTTPQNPNHHKSLTLKRKLFDDNLSVSSTNSSINDNNNLDNIIRATKFWKLDLPTPNSRTSPQLAQRFRNILHALPNGNDRNQDWQSFQRERDQAIGWIYRSGTSAGGSSKKKTKFS